VPRDRYKGEFPQGIVILFKKNMNIIVNIDYIKEIYNGEYQ